MVRLRQQRKYGDGQILRSNRTDASFHDLYSEGIPLKRLLGIFLIAAVALSAQGPPPDILTSQAAAATALMNYKTWVEARLTAHDAAIIALQNQSPVPGPQGPQGIPGNPSSAIGILVYPQILVYNPQNINTTSTAQFVMVSNQTSQPLPLAASLLSGPFQLGGGGNCGSLASLPAGQNCVYGVQFKTASIGAKIGTLTVNVGGLQLSVNLEGMGQ